MRGTNNATDLLSEFCLHCSSSRHLHIVEFMPILQHIPCREAIVNLSTKFANNDERYQPDRDSGNRCGLFYLSRSNLDVRRTMSHQFLCHDKIPPWNQAKMAREAGMWMLTGIRFTLDLKWTSMQWTCSPRKVLPRVLSKIKKLGCERYGMCSPIWAQTGPWGSV